jgi:hypothetical protein
VVGWAAYDWKTDYLSPEHFLSDRLRRTLFQSCGFGELLSQGPDGKLLVRIRENPNAWCLEHVVGEAYSVLRQADSRWVLDWDAVE